MIRLSRLLALACIACIACGQKGPPRAPIVYLPRAVTDVVAKRVENEVVLQFTVPTVNTDGSAPADLRRVEVYAHTGPLPAADDYLKYGTRIASIDIKQPPTPEQQEAQGEAATAAAETTPPPALGPDDDSEAGLMEQGSKTSVREALTPAHMEIGAMPPTRPLPLPDPKAPVVVVEKLETPGTVNFELRPQRSSQAESSPSSRSRKLGTFQLCGVTSGRALARQAMSKG